MAMQNKNVKAIKNIKSTKNIKTTKNLKSIKSAKNVKATVDGRSFHPDSLHEKHVEYVCFREKGMSNNQASALVGFRAETGSRIWAKYQNGGWDALKPRKRGAQLGYRRALTPVQEKEIKRLIRCFNPKNLNLPYPAWNRVSVKQLIAEKYAVNLAVRTISLYFSRWGFTYHRKRLEVMNVLLPN